MHREEENCMGLVSVLNGQLRTYILSDKGREVTLFRVHTEEVCVLSTSCLGKPIKQHIGFANKSQIEAMWK